MFRSLKILAANLYMWIANAHESEKKPYPKKHNTDNNERRSEAVSYEKQTTKK